MAKPALLGLAEHLHVHPRVCTADDRADGYDYDIYKVVQFTRPVLGCSRPENRAVNKAAIELSVRSLLQ